MSNEHYKQGNIECIDYIRDVLSPEEFQGFCRGNIIKYMHRLTTKDDPLKNAKKIEDYTQWLIESLTTN